MTPEDIRSQRFTTRLLHGLSPEEVSAFLEDFAEDFGNIQHAHARRRSSSRLRRLARRRRRPSRC